MQGEVIWEDSPSQTLNLTTWFFSLIAGIAIFYGLPKAYGILTPMLVPILEYIRIGAPIIVVANLVWAVASVAVRGYKLSDTELVEQSGVFNQRIDSLELFRVKDITISKPLILRFFGQGNLILSTSDHSTPVVVLEAIREPEVLLPKLRELVLIARKKTGVREFD